MYVAVELQTNFHIAAIRSNVCAKVYRCGCNASLVVTITVRANNIFVQPHIAMVLSTKVFTPQKMLVLSNVQEVIYSK